MKSLIYIIPIAIFVGFASPSQVDVCTDLGVQYYNLIPLPGHTTSLTESDIRDKCRRGNTDVLIEAFTLTPTDIAQIEATNAQHDAKVAEAEATVRAYKQSMADQFAALEGNK